MHQSGPFDLVCIAMFFACFFIRMPHEYKTRRVKRVESRDNALEKFNLLLVFTGSLTLPALYFFSPWFRFANYEVYPAVGICGSITAVIGVWLLWRSHKDLGRQFSATLEVKEMHALVTNGVYKRIRHPMYTAAFLVSFSQMLLLGNWVVGSSFLLAFLSLYLVRIDNEERMMLDHFGQEYADYMKRTNRLFPGLKERA